MQEVTPRAFKAFDATPQTPADSRRFVRDLISQCAENQPRFNDVAERVALLTTELVTDAVAHRAATVHLLAMCLDDRVRVEIYDTERESNVAEGEDPETQRIRMNLLSRLADRWATAYVGTGQLNWFELVVPAHA